MKILLVGGGTGGHIYPLLALTKSWENIPSRPKNLDFHFVIARNNSDKDILKHTKYSYSELPVAKLRRYFSLQNFLDFFVFIANIFRSARILSDHRPDCIFSKGGFVSLPLCLTAKIYNIPFYLHETDSAMGLSNRILSKYAEKIFTGFPSKNPQHIFVGNPVREEFFLSPTKQEKEHSGQWIQIFIFGGSQGAANINKWARIFFSEYFNATYKTEVLLVTGKGKKHDPLFEEDNHGIRPHFSEVEFLQNDFVDKIHEADIVIARAGGSLSELAAAQKCSILIPLPSAANDHQRRNAEFFGEKNAALVIEENTLYSDDTLRKIEHLIMSKTARTEYEKNISDFAKSGVAEQIWAEIYGK